MSMLTAWRRQPTTSIWCQGCSTEWPTCAMGWTDTGLYRCRRCNPNPGPPHAAQTPAQRQRSERYAKASITSQRCTECGRKLRKHSWSPCSPQPGAETVPTEVVLCDDCVGPDPFEHGWMGFDIVRM